MRSTLQKRVSELEAAADTSTSARQKEENQPTSGGEHLLRRLATSGYNTWRHECLSLEELLALARDDYARTEEISDLSDTRGHRKAADGRWADISAGSAAREFEIRILERDGKIDERDATALRENCRKHFFSGVDVGRSSIDSDVVPLNPLPTPIDIDEAAVLASARAKCPRRVDLPLERQLEMVHEDYQHHLAERQERRPSSADPLLDKCHGFAVARVEGLIRDRDALRVEPS